MNTFNYLLKPNRLLLRIMFVNAPNKIHEYIEIDNYFEIESNQILNIFVN